MTLHGAYPVEAAWRSAVQGVRESRPGAMFTGLIPLLILWLLAAAHTGFSRASIVQTGTPLAILLALGAASAVNHIRWKRRRAHLGLTRWTVFINASIVSLYLLTLSGYFLQLSLAVATSGMYRLFLSSWALALMVGVYAFSAAAAIVWSPRSIPVSKGDDDQATVRGARWLPWILGAQGSAVGIAIFLSMISARGKLAGGWLWLVGVGTLGAAFMVFFGVLMFYRLIFLVRHPVPAVVQEEFGLRT